MFNLCAVQSSGVVILQIISLHYNVPLLRWCSLHLSCNDRRSPHHLEPCLHYISSSWRLQHWLIWYNIDTTQTMLQHCTDTESTLYFALDALCSVLPCTSNEFISTMFCTLELYYRHKGGRLYFKWGQEWAAMMESRAWKIQYDANRNTDVRDKQTKIWFISIWIFLSSP